MDVPVRVEKAQGIRRVFFHVTGLQPEEAGKKGLDTLPRWLLPLPEAVTFESYLDPFGVDTFGREKFRLRKRLRVESPPYEQEAYKRRNQLFYPGDEPIIVHLDPKDSEEVVSLAAGLPSISLADYSMIVYSPIVRCLRGA